MFSVEDIYFILLFAILVRGFIDLIFTSLPLLWVIGKKLSNFLENKLNRIRRSMATRSLRGGLFLVFLILCAVTLGMIVEFLQGTPYFPDVVTFISFYICISFVSPIKLHYKIYKLLENTKDNRDKIIDILQSVGMPISRVARNKEVFVRLSIVSVGYSLNRFVVAPIIWFMLLGFSGMFFYVLVMSSAIALPRNENFDFGWSSRMTARLLDIIPSMVTALILFVSSWSSFGARPSSVIRSVKKDVKNTAGYGILLIQSVISGAVGCVLGGMSYHWYIDKHIGELWLGQSDDSAKGKRHQLRSAIRLFIVSESLVILLVSLLVSTLSI